MSRIVRTAINGLPYGLLILLAVLGVAVKSPAVAFLALVVAVVYAAWTGVGRTPYAGSNRLILWLLERRPWETSGKDDAR